MKKKSPEGKENILKEVRECVEQYKHFYLLDEEFALCKTGGGPPTFQAELTAFLRQKHLIAVALGKWAQDE
ncbi:hypothetical protein niasHS_009054 [Heterodera schachtii]|uniref:Uncharacterized protein n=1 Tax=Heterodera schachtii TaxID=97005 RepID=A0ABD2J816_HETSC